MRQRLGVLTRRQKFLERARQLDVGLKVCIQRGQCSNPHRLRAFVHEQLSSHVAFLDRRALGLGLLHRERPRDESTVTYEQLAALKEKRFPAVRLAVKAQLARHRRPVGGANVVEQPLIVV
jgi:hypothetical protein